MEHPATRKVDGDDAGLSVGLAQQRQRQAVRVEDRIVLLLPAVEVQRLLEIARLVEEANSHDRHAKVRGGLEVVPRENAETTGVLRQCLGDAVLGTEVGDRRRSAPFYLVRPALVPTGLAQVDGEILDRSMDLAEKCLVQGKGLELVSREG